MNLNLYLNHASSIEADGNLDDWVPTDPCDVWLYVYLDIKAKNSDEFFEFTVVVATLSSLEERFKDELDELVSDRGMLLYKSVTWRELERDLIRIVKACDSSNWNESIKLLQRYFMWEYEGM